MSRSWRRTALLTLLFTCAPVAAEPADLHKAIAKARAKAVDELNALILWARKKKVMGFRMDILETILILDPDHKATRRKLNYRRKKNGPWTRKEAPARPADGDWTNVRNGKRKRLAILTTYKDRVLDALASCPDPEPDPDGELIEHLMQLVPNDRRLRTLRGDVQHRGRWVLPDTKVAEQRRAELRAHGDTLVAEYRKAVREADKATKGSWPHGWQTSRYAVFGSGPTGLLRSACVLMEAAEGMCDRLVGESGRRRRSVKRTLFLTGKAEALRIARQEESWRRRIPDIKRAGGVSIDGLDVVFFRDQNFSRMSCPRSVIDFGTKLAFGHKANRGWIIEGMGQRITWYTSGEHGPPFFSKSQTGGPDDYDVSFPDTVGAWPAAAAKVIARDGPPALLGVLTRSLNAMTEADVLVAYGLAAFLIEARPGQFIAFAKASAKRHDVEAFMKETLGVPNAAVFTRHLQRWLAEYRDA